MDRMPSLMSRRAALVLPVIGFMVCSHAPAQTPAAPQRSKRIKITIGAKTCVAALEDNAAVRAFQARLPLRVNMTDLNGNEKYFRLAIDLPTDASNPGTIQTGDLMLYGSKTLVLFYKSFPTSYQYTRLGRIKDTKGLAVALGSGSVTLSFDKE